ncbi:MAG: hypothetical protein GX131_14375 [candidate division WS1 bacterium]|jgi:hypothetical protein|nr:hypothetical protein [candidate division WS1 bacterium]
MARTFHLPDLNLRHIAWVVVAYAGLVAAIWPRRTYDLWWHLATGKFIIDTGEIPHADPFTWTRAGAHWIAHEWGWEIPLYLLYNTWGFDGLLVLRGAIGLLCALLLVWLCMNGGATPLAVMATGVLVIYAARPLFNDRPQVASMPLFLAMLCLIDAADRGRPKWLLAAPLLMVLWVNLHGGFVYGIGLLGLYALCRVPEWFMRYRAGEKIGPTPAFLGAGIILSLAACLVNPNGVEGAIYPLGYVFGDHSWHKSFITEYASPDFSQEIFLWLGALIVLSTAAFAASGHRSRLWDVALTAVFLYSVLKWQRNTALYAFALAPVLAMHLSDLLGRMNVGGLEDADRERGPAALYWAIVLTLVIAAGLAFPPAMRRAPEAFRTDLPVECVQWAKDNDLQGRMYNTYRWGGYLIWEMWPQQRVFVDGRADVMGRELIQDWQKAHKMNEGWTEALYDYEIDWAIVSISSPLVRGLELHPQWRVACEEPTAKLFVRVGSVADTADGPTDN